MNSKKGLHDAESHRPTMALDARPRSGDRFAHQDCYGPPPEFPLASSCPGIVHHLSGPNNMNLKSLRRLVKSIRLHWLGRKGITDTAHIGPRPESCQRE
ncbi:hypothetical protein H920_04838 [Fukomys damarensis]|uniref:Uncharacterized protein n=1 Tax=Fukomys damarensis TaxID=885580 RepID=A0A091DNY3_FUKDA|nr:hypothetical protein H920_04838 [Fukomys damarensis]